MSTPFSPLFTLRSYPWSTWKAVKQTRFLNPQYEDDGATYTVWGYDGFELHTTTIWKGMVPPGVVDGGYSQAQNDADKADFEAGYLPSANKPLALTATQLTGYVTTSNATTTAVRATAYAEPAANAQRSLASSSASDTAAGTGARQVRVTYYDATLATRASEVVTLNGTTPVNLVATAVCFIEKMEVVAVGAGGGNAGTVTLFGATAGGGGVVGTIAPSDNQTNWCHHYIGVGVLANVLAMTCGNKGASSGAVTLRRNVPTDPTKPDLVITPQLRVPAGDSRALSFVGAPLPVVGPAKLVLYVQQDAASGSNAWFAGLGYQEV